MLQLRLLALGALVLCGAPNPSHAQAPAGASTSVDPALFSSLRYRMIGPARGGRVTAVTGVIQEPHTFYFGSTGGGVWKTTDAGGSWTNVTDGFLDLGSIGSLDVSDSDPRVVWVGTGSEGLRSNVSIGRGIWKSTDAGATWTAMGLRETGQLGAVIIHPNNPEVVLAAAVGNPFAPNRDRGVYRTQDGGRTWTKTLFISDSTGVVDLEFHPGDPNTRLCGGMARRAQAVDDHQRRERGRALSQPRWWGDLDQDDRRAALPGWSASRTWRFLPRRPTGSTR